MASATPDHRHAAEQRDANCRIRVASDPSTWRPCGAPRDAVEVHLKLCKHCARYVQQVRRTLVLAAGRQAVDIPLDDLDAFAARYNRRR